MSRQVSPERTGSNKSSRNSSPMRRVARVETSSSQGSYGKKLDALREYWGEQKFDPEWTINPSHFTAPTAGLRKSASAANLAQQPSAGTSTQYGGVVTGARFDPRRRSPPRTGLEDIRTHFGGPARQDTGDTTAATIASLEEAGTARPPTAVVVAHGYTQGSLALPSAPVNTQRVNRHTPTRRPTQPAMPSRTASANNARPARQHVDARHQSQGSSGGKRDGRGRGRGGSGLQPPRLPERSRSQGSLDAARNLGRDLRNAGRQVWHEGLFNVLSGSGGSSRDSSRGRDGREGRNGSRPQ